VVGTPQICGSQGIASDGKSLWFSWNFGLTHTTLAMDRTLDVNCVNAIPESLRLTGHSHIGDIDLLDGVLYTPIEDGGTFLEPVIALFRAKDLSFTGKIFPLERKYMTRGVPWVAVDGPRHVAYTSEWTGTVRLNVHRLSDFKVIRTVPLDKEVPRIQGAKVFRGQLYLSRDNGAEKSIEAIDPETGHVTHLFDRDLGTNWETEGIAFIRRPTGTEMALLELYEGTTGDPNDPYTAWVKRYRINGDTTPPVLTGLQLQPRRIRLASHPQALRVRVTASESVTVAARWLRCTGPDRKPCSRTRPVGPAFDRTLTAGANRFSLPARAGKRALADGRWRLQLTPTDEADIRGKAVEIGLAIAPPRLR